MGKLRMSQKSRSEMKAHPSPMDGNKHLKDMLETAQRLRVNPFQQTGGEWKFNPNGHQSMKMDEPAVIRVEMPPRIVEVIKEVRVEVPVEKIVHLTGPTEVIYVDREVIKEIEKRVEVKVPFEVVKTINVEIPKIVIRHKVPGWAVLAMGIEAVLVLALLVLK